MRTHRIAALVLLFVAASAAFAADTPRPVAPTNPLWEQMKKLEGTWVSNTKEGAVKNSYRLTSGGSALLAVTTVPGEGEMVTIYHQVGQTVVGTHYCLMMNQPSFVASPGPDPNVISFKFKSVDNLKTPTSGHMRSVVFKFADNDHHSEVWTYREKGKDTAETFASERQK